MKLRDRWEGGWTVDLDLSLPCAIAKGSVQVGPVRELIAGGQGWCEKGLCSYPATMKS